jgi:5-methylcytosine-specific restriction endonuclease McrA
MAKKVKKPKERTVSKMRSCIIGGMRQAFSNFSPKYMEVKLRCRVEEKWIKKDGTPAKRPHVWYICDNCENRVKDPEFNIDHMNPVIPVDKVGKDMSLDELWSRLDCPIENLQGLCSKCHDEKTSFERSERMRYRKLRSK